MTAKEALWVVKVQLQDNEQNRQALKVLEGIINLPVRHIDDEPNTVIDEINEKALEAIKERRKHDETHRRTK